MWKLPSNKSFVPHLQIFHRYNWITHNEWLVRLISFSQAVYQSLRGTIEQIFSLEQIIEKSIEFNRPVYIVFIDFTKEFDSIKLDCFWKLLEQTCIKKRYINLLKLTYDNSTAVIKTKIGITRPIKILKGVKQGDVLSALLFSIVIAAIILKSRVRL